MTINLFEAKYVPTIFLRNAELKAVSELPDSSKDILTPILCLKPWLTSKNLEKSMEKIESVFGHRQYFIDVDHFYDVGEIKRPAQEEFLELIDSEDDHSNWIEFFEERPNVYPCLRLEHGDDEKVRRQVEAFTEMDRTFLVRLQFGEVLNPIGICESVCEVADHSDFGFVVDVGWSRDILSLQVWADGIIKKIVELRGDGIPIIVSGSSFPNSFTTFATGEAVPVYERQLFSRLRSDNNEARLVYGDWASSRSPTEGGGGGKPPPRIDLSTQTSWEIYRFPDEDGGFPAAAVEAMDSSNYPDDLDIWATYMIEATALDDPNGIGTSGTKAAAVRINLHLYNQLYFESLSIAPQTDDEYVE